MMFNSTLQDRYRGVLLASAAGDALGATLEFLTSDQIQAHYGGPLRDIIGGGWLQLPAGEVTDDTQMALCIAHSIVESGRFDPDDIAAKFVEWYRSEPPDIGNTTRSALQYLADGLAWAEAGKRTHQKMAPRDASNGSVMRSAPVALYARTDSTANAKYSAISSEITHANPLAVQGTVALNAAIAGLLNDPASDPLDAAITAITEPTLRDSLTLVPELAGDDLNAGGYVLDTLQAAFWAILRHDSLEEAIIAGVNLGNDTDTTGAVAGALAGAKWGASSIPARWLDVLRPRAELTDLADRLLELSNRIQTQ